MPLNSELDADLLRQLRWTDMWDDIRQRVREEAARGRKIAHLLPRWGDERLDPDAIPDTRIEIEESPSGLHQSYIPGRPSLVSAEIASEFRISPEQFGDRAIAMHLVTKAAHQVGLAEDLVLLWGENLTDAKFQNYGLKVRHENLEKQTKYVYEKPAGAPAGWHPPRMNPDAILESIQDAIQKLQDKGQYGEYCVIVSRDLYEAAFQPRAIQSGDDGPVSYAPINQIRPLLREGGFAYSPLALPGTGAIFSLGGGAIGVAAPQEAHVAYVGMQRDVILRVQERVRFLIKEEGACLLLEKPHKAALRLSFHPRRVRSGGETKLRIESDVLTEHNWKDRDIELKSTRPDLVHVNSSVKMKTLVEDGGYRILIRGQVDDITRVTVRAKIGLIWHHATVVVEPPVGSELLSAAPVR